MSAPAWGNTTANEITREIASNHSCHVSVNYYPESGWGTLGFADLGNIFLAEFWDRLPFIILGFFLQGFQNLGGGMHEKHLFTILPTEAWHT